MSTTTTKLISDIKIGTRHRKDMGDVAGLARSIGEVGLLHPIVVRPDGTLIAGERRLAAFKHLSRTEIPVTVVDLDNIVRGELAENAERKDFLPSEIDAIRKALEPVVATPVGRPSKEMVENFHPIGRRLTILGRCRFICPELETKKRATL
jgi:ParB/RepB/Spo0J family partition protein